MYLRVIPFNTHNLEMSKKQMSLNIVFSSLYTGKFPVETERHSECLSFGNQDQDQRFKSEFALTASIYGKSLLAVLSKLKIKLAPILHTCHNWMDPILWFHSESPQSALNLKARQISTNELSSTTTGKTEPVRTNKNMLKETASILIKTPIKLIKNKDHVTRPRKKKLGGTVCCQEYCYENHCFSHANFAKK
ncbi:uncharacterized protein LOC110857550 [Folsomia candida]|uniref:uncharacterized protein LOC110857550 n=1 Tax=Folsomia candida TaxID=158441 RepID=UPI000B8F82FC|nr:uncharacterized protein LOC110857550 [Folsomia candida]